MSNTDIKSIATLQQSLPIQSDRPSAHDVLIEVVQERKQLGLQRYRSLLQPHNGRDQMVDLLQELVDGSAYLICVIQERDELLKRVEKLEAIATSVKRLIESSDVVEHFGVAFDRYEIDGKILREIEQAMAQLEGK